MRRECSEIQSLNERTIYSHQRKIGNRNAEKTDLILDLQVQHTLLRLQSAPDQPRKSSEKHHSIIAKFIPSQILQWDLPAGEPDFWARAGGWITTTTISAVRSVPQGRKCAQCVPGVSICRVADRLSRNPEESRSSRDAWATLHRQTGLVIRDLVVQMNKINRKKKIKIPFLSKQIQQKNLIPAYHLN